MKITTRFTLLILSTACCVAGAFAAQDAQSERITQVRASYGVDFWPKGQVRDGFPLASLEVPGFRGNGIRSWQGLISRGFLPVGAPIDATAQFLVEGWVADSAEGAQDQAVRWLAGLSAPNPAPEDGRFGVELGEAGHVGPSGAGPRALSWVSFVRGNVAVRVMNLDLRTAPELDLLAIARVLDASIAVRAPLAPGVAVPRPQVLGLKASSTDVVAGDVVALDFTVQDTAGGIPHTQWSVSGSGQGYVERHEDGWHLFTTGPGEVTVTLELTASTGTYAERSIEIFVADD
jgi:hypothetical protein